MLHRDTRPGSSPAPPQFAPISAKTPILFPSMSREPFALSTETAGALEQQGFRVALPEWWTRRESGVDVCARPVIKPSPVSSGAGMFSLSELMQFDWEVAIGFLPPFRSGPIPRPRCN
jgi:hypothetical protein